MKVTELDYEIASYSKDLRVEVLGETYRVGLDWDKWDGYSVTFLTEKGVPIDYPQWAQEYEEDMDNTDSLGSWLDSLATKIE